MKRFLYLLPAFALVFAACSDGKEKPTTPDVSVKASDIKNAPGKDDIDAVKLTVNNKAIVTVDWEEGFSLEFPETIVATNLDLLTEEFFEGEIPEGVTVSNKTAKICYASVDGYKNSDFKGEFFRGDASGDRKVAYVYSDSDVTVKGTDSWDDDEMDTEWVEKFELTLKKGWNDVLESRSESGRQVIVEFTTTIPSGMSWYYEKVSGGR